MTEQTSQDFESKEKVKLEWGLEIGQMNWYDALKKVDELNLGLTETERWRMPTSDELLAKFNETESLPEGFKGGYYLSSTLVPDHAGEFVCVGMSKISKAYTTNGEKTFPNAYLHCVRDTQ